MPEKKTLERARRDKREGKAPTTQAGEFVKEEMDHVKEGKHGVKNRKQAIAIGLSKARKAGIAVPPKKSAGKKTAAKKTKPASIISRSKTVASKDKPKTKAKRSTKKK